MLIRRKVNEKITEVSTFGFNKVITDGKKIYGKIAFFPSGFDFSKLRAIEELKNSGK